MNPAIPSQTTTASTITSSTITTSTATSSTTSGSTHVLEISLISAQDLAQVSKSMRTYAVAWIRPNHKRTTRVDQQGHNNPTWNDTISFRVKEELLYSDETAVTVEIHTVSWLRDVLVGTIRVLLTDLITPCARNSTRFVSLQIRRPTGLPQGKLNMGVSLIDGTMPLNTDYHDTLQKTIDKMSLQDKPGQFNDDNDHKMNSKIQLWRSHSLGTSDVNEEFPVKAGSMVDGSMVNGSELCSDVGPSASIVAAEIAQKSRSQPPIPDKSTNNLQQHTKEESNGSSIVEDLTIEEARAKGLMITRHSRRHSSDGGLFSCFGNTYGFEFTIVCGSSTCSFKPKESKSQRRRLTYSETNSAQVINGSC